LAPRPGGSGLLGRVTGILTRPAEEWRVIDGEPGTVGSVIAPYALVLAAIPPLAMLLGLMLFGGAYASYFFSLVLQVAIVFYVLNVAVAVALGLAIDALAPNLGGAKNQVQAMKLAVYSSTPLWVAGLVLLLLTNSPGLFWIWFVVGFAYGAYLLFIGLPILMRVPADKAPGYAGAAIAAWFVLMLIARFLAGAMVGGPF
jgi:hypothetical protein